MEYLSDCLIEPEDSKKIFHWDTLSIKSQRTLKRAIEKSDARNTSQLAGFSFNLLRGISLEDLNNARYVGSVRTEELLQELKFLFDNPRLNNNLDPENSTLTQTISVSSSQTLLKLIVEEDLDKYVKRISSFELLTNQQRYVFLKELSPSKNPFKRMISGKQDQETAIVHLINANLRLSFTHAKRVCIDKEIRARTIAANLGLLAGIISFSEKSNTDFESHILKYVREFILDLIGSSNLSYDEILELMLDKNEVELYLSEYEENVQAEVPFKNCENFSELYEELDHALLKLPKVDERAIAMLKHRHQAFGEPGLTLEDLGQEWGVTRERVRQIVDPLMKVIIQTEYEVEILQRAVELFEQCEDLDEFSSVVAENEIFSGIDITWERLWGLAHILSPDVLADRILTRLQEIEAHSDENSTIRALVKKDRSKFGLYDLNVVSNKYDLSQDKAFKIILEIYPRSIRIENLVLARTKNLDTMFENTIAKQLKVLSPLEVSDLLKGLERAGKFRDVSLIGSKNNLSNLIFKLAGDPPNFQTISSGLIKEVEFQNLEKWLIEIFSEANLGILHSNDVVNFALRDGVNITSATVYLGRSPITRAHGKSLFSLVGTDVTKDQLDAYTQIIRGTTEASEVSYEMTSASKGILSVKPNLNVITSGIIFPSSGHKKIFEGFEFKSSCLCGELETTQAVKFAPSGFWTGFTAMIRHGLSQHQMSKGSTFRFEFDFDNSLVTLLVN